MSRCLTNARATSLPFSQCLTLPLFPKAAQVRLRVISNISPSVQRFQLALSRLLPLTYTDHYQKGQGPDLLSFLESHCLVFVNLTPGDPLLLVQLPPQEEPPVSPATHGLHSPSQSLLAHKLRAHKLDHPNILFFTIPHSIGFYLQIYVENRLDPQQGMISISVTPPSHRNPAQTPLNAQHPLLDLCRYPPPGHYP